MITSSIAWDRKLQGLGFNSKMSGNVSFIMSTLDQADLYDDPCPVRPTLSMFWTSRDAIEERNANDTCSLQQISFQLERLMQDPPQRKDL